MELVDDTSKGPTAVRAAQYVRMSTDLQRYSTENQATAIQQYAAQRGILIVRTYADDGRSGLTFHRRDALKQLIDDIQHHRADYSLVLVYDVSRWGRFQDADESAHYEFICRQAGISVCYCAEEFVNDGSLHATIIKNLKRAMAAEYSRELSVKVHAGHCRLATLGFRQGGSAGYALRRQLVDGYRQPKSLLELGQRKSLHTDRVVLVPGPADEVETVRRIYHLAAHQGANAYSIARMLNDEGKKNHLGRPWRYDLVRDILKNEKYIGHHVYNRTWAPLGIYRGLKDPGAWIKVRDAFEPIVSPDLFDAVRAEHTRRARRRTDEEMIQCLSELLSTEGCLSAALINKQKGFPSSEAYKIRFGTLCRAFELAGFKPRRGSRSVAVSQAIRQQLEPRFVEEVTKMTRRSGGTVLRDPFSGLLRVNGDILVRATIARCYRTFHGKVFWGIRSEPEAQPDITIAARMDEKNETWVDYVIAPHFSVGYPPLYLRFEQDTFTWNAYRFSSLGCLPALFSRIGLSDVHPSTASSARMQRHPMMPNVLGGGKIVRQRLSKNTVLVRARRIESERQALVKRGKLAQGWLSFAAGAFRTLLSDDHIETVLRAEKFTSLPSVLALSTGKRVRLRTSFPGATNRDEAECVDDILHLVVAVCSLSKMLQNPRIEHALRQSYPVLLKDLRAVIAVVSSRSARHSCGRPMGRGS